MAKTVRQRRYFYGGAVWVAVWDIIFTDGILVYLTDDEAVRFSEAANLQAGATVVHAIRERIDDRSPAYWPLPGDLLPR